MKAKFDLKIAFGACAFATSLVAPSIASAATATGTFAVTATVANSCTVSAAAAAFGTYNFGAAATAQTTLSVSCTTGTSVASVFLNNGANPTGTTTIQNNMKAGGTAVIPYGLYQNVALTTAWNTTTGPAAFTATSTATSFTVYAQAPSGANVPAGSYTDTVTATVTYT